MSQPGFDAFGRYEALSGAEMSELQETGIFGVFLVFRDLGFLGLGLMGLGFGDLGFGV